MPKMSRKWRRQAPIGETLALFGHDQHPRSKTLAPLGLLQPVTRANKPNTLPHAPEIVQPAMGGVLITKTIVPSARG